MNMSSPAWFKLFAVLLLLFVASEILLIYVLHAHQSQPLTTRNHLWFATTSVLQVTVAIGLFRLRKWAALIFALATLACGAVLIVGSMVKVPLPFMLINIAYGVGFMLPTFVTIRCWPVLVWRRGT